MFLQSFSHHPVFLFSRLFARQGTLKEKPWAQLSKDNWTFLFPHVSENKWILLNASLDPHTSNPIRCVWPLAWHYFAKLVYVVFPQTSPLWTSTFSSLTLSLRMRSLMRLTFMSSEDSLPPASKDYAKFILGSKLLESYLLIFLQYQYNIILNGQAGHSYFVTATRRRVFVPF